MIRVTTFKPQAAAPRAVGPGQQRKIGIIGSHGTTLVDAPWHDPSWEFWGHASVAKLVPQGRVSMYIDVHPPHCFQKARKNGFKDYYDWLKHQPTPILMQARYPEIPQSIAYPLDEIKGAWPTAQFGSQTAYMIAFALSRGVTHIGLWGVEYSHDSEYRFQRGNAQMWMGIAMGRGVQVQVSRHSTLLRDDVDYAYETHATPELVEAWIEKCGWRKKTKPEAGAVADVSKLVFADTPEAVEAARQKRLQDPEFAGALVRMEADEEKRAESGPEPHKWVSIAPKVPVE